MMRRFKLHARALQGGALLAFALAAFAADAHPQRRPGAKHADLMKAETKSESPRFSDYPAGEIYRGRIAPVVLDTKRARMF
ncbi:MAG TPA: hypothetical protein VD835_18780, partial [Pyrinomonadaceae bacterium]|nr:hypothetical protein [Pyrinomonadaceae bacterium]